MIYMYSIHIRNADIVLICVYMYNIYTVFLLLFITVFFTVLFYIVKLNIIFLCTISSTCYVRIQIIIIIIIIYANEQANIISISLFVHDVILFNGTFSIVYRFCSVCIMQCICSRYCHLKPLLMQPRKYLS